MTQTTSNALASTKQVTKTESNISLTKVHILTEIDLGKKAILLLGIIFIFMAMTSVMTQVLLPNILELTGLEIIGLPEPSSTTILADFFDNIFIIALIIILLIPKIEICSRTSSLAPSPIESIATTAATPIMTPSIVKNVRSLCELNESKET